MATSKAAKPAATKKERAVPAKGKKPGYEEELESLARQGAKTEESAPPTTLERAKVLGLKLPASLGACVDLYKELQTQRLDRQKEVDAIEKREKLVKEHVLANLGGADRGAVGKFYQGVAVPKSRPELEDPQKFYAHIKKTGEFELLNKALNKSAINERWDAGKTVPGVGKFTYFDLSVTKIKG